MDVSIREETEEVAGLAVQGPTSYAILSKMGLDGLGELKPFGLMHFDFEGTELMVSRTGFTGDLGYELWISPDKAEALWDALFEAGKLHGIRAIGTHALELARVEAGYPGGISGFPAGECHRAHRPHALAARTRPRLAGRLQEAGLQRPPGPGRRDAQRLDLAPRQARYRGQQGRAQFLHLREREG